MQQFVRERGKVLRPFSNTKNLQNIPAGSFFGKLIKSIFMGPDAHLDDPGWLFCGADFSSLEAMIDALTTRDPEKLGVYTEGYDSHAYNAVTYWPSQMPDVVSQMEAAKVATEFFLVEYEDGTKEYICR